MQSPHGAAPFPIGMMRRMTPSVEWEDLVLPAATRESLRRLRDRLIHRAVIAEAGRLSERRMLETYPVCGLFVGPAGCGKSMTAEALARNVGVDFISVDLAPLEGETTSQVIERLGPVFSDMEKKRTLVLFDNIESAPVGAALFLQRIASEVDCIVIQSTGISIEKVDPKLKRGAGHV
ncbi:AAA family ATPase, partial [bacterium]|nr:AAA family ATPase [bacterium]